MIKLENTEVLGWEHAIRGMRNPYSIEGAENNSWEKSDSHFHFGEVLCKDCAHSDQHPCGQNCLDVGPNDQDLMKRLANGGPVHAKYRRMIAVYVDITAPLYWWKEFDTYKVGTVANSCSTMHKIAAKEFTLEDFSCEHLEDLIGSNYDDSLLIDVSTYHDDSNLYSPAGVLTIICKALNRYRERYLETKDKKYWWQMIQLLPSSYNQKRTVMLNYEVLAGIYPSRKDHKLDEWHVFCDWIKDLPYSEIIVGERSNGTGEPEEKKDLKDVPISDEIMEEAKRRVLAEIEEHFNQIQEQYTVPACDLCNIHGRGDSDEEACKKCKFYKSSKWAKKE